MAAGRRPTLAVTASRVRLDERLLMAALRRRGVPFEHVDTSRLHMVLDRPPGPHLGVLSREASQARAVCAARVFELHGVPVINSAAVMERCGDRLQATLALRAAGVPTPRTAIATTPDAALAAASELGYPALVKTLIASRASRPARLADVDVAEAVLEHRAALAGPWSEVAYVREWVRPERAITGYVIGGEVVCAVSDGPAACEVTDELDRLLRAASAAVGGGILRIAVLELPDGALLVDEVDHTPELHAAAGATGVDIAGAMVDYALRTLPLD